MKLAHAYQAQGGTVAAWRRDMTPAAKFAVCKRALAFTGETMEACGGNGYVAPSILGRLYREASVNAIWEGSGNVMCLDVLRALSRSPETLETLLAQLRAHACDDPPLVAELSALHAMAGLPADALQTLARQFTIRLVTVAQGCLLNAQTSQTVADAFMRRDTGCTGATWLARAPSIALVSAILARALP